jgi:hypothetical protein
VRLGKEFNFQRNLPLRRLPRLVGGTRIPPILRAAIPRAISARARAAAAISLGAIAARSAAVSARRRAAAPGRTRPSGTAAIVAIPARAIGRFAFVIGVTVSRWGFFQPIG